MKMNLSAIHQVWDKYADRIFKDGYRFNPVYLASKALADWFLLAGVDLESKSVLNIGCAEPIDELQFIEKVDCWFALDNNEKVLKAAEAVTGRRLHPDLFAKLRFVSGDATGLPFADATFDIVTSFSAIEHIPDRKKRKMSIKEMARVVKKGGYVIVTVPNRWNAAWHLWSLRAMREGRTDFGYCYNYSPLELRREMVEAGLKVIKFSSDYRRTYGLVPFVPIDGVLERFFVYFGERMGWLAQR